MSNRHQLSVRIEDKPDQALVWVDGVPIGKIIGGYFTQKAQYRHLFRRYNSKGIEYDVLERLQTGESYCAGWRLVFSDGHILSILLEKIQEVGLLNPRGSTGYQYHVRMRDFNEDQAALQRALF